MPARDSFRVRFARAAAARAVVVVCLALLLPVATAHAGKASPKSARPELELPLEPLGYLGYNALIATQDASLLTASFVDATHVLVTFHARTLVARSSEDKKDDQTRNVAAVLLELPSGKVLARTEWHVFDYARYLWPLGDGSFLLRIRDTLRVIAPLRGLAKGDAFEQTVLVRANAPLVAVAVSPVGHVLTVETAMPRRKLTASGAVQSAAAADATGPVSVELLRVEMGDTPQAITAARAQAAGPFQLPVDDAGFLHSVDDHHGGWRVVYTPFGTGAPQPMAAAESSCAPLLEFASRSQYVALECRGTQDKLALSGFDFSGHELWQERFVDDSRNFVFRYAPAAGRFAVSRTMDVSARPGDATGSVPPEAASSQELRVYATESGDLLLQVRVPQPLKDVANFDLSADGKRLLLVRDGKLVLYALPTLSRSEERDLADARALEPPQGSGPMSLAALGRESARERSAEATAEGSAVVSAAQPLPSATAPTNSVAQAAEAEAGDLAGAQTVAAEQRASAEGGSGDAAPGTRRKPPTLLNPGEQPEFKTRKRNSEPSQ